MTYDVVVVGAGVNGLAAAAELARAGRRVRVLERGPTHGGLAARAEFHPGFTAPGLLHDTDLVRRELVAPLELERHGLVWRDDDPGVLAPHGAGAHPGPGLVLYRDAAPTLAEIETHAYADVPAYRAFAGFVARVAPMLRQVLEARPPVVIEPRGTELLRLALTGVAARRLGERDLLELARMLPSAAGDWVSERFDTPLLRALLASAALPCTALAPRSAGSSLLLLLRCAFAHGGVRGGPAAVADALLGAAREHGVALAFDTEARALRLEGGRVAGVETQAGEVVATRAVALTCDPRRALELLPAGALPLSTERALAGVRLRGNTAVLRLALAGPLAFAGRRGEHFEAVRTAGTLDELERAADALKYGALPERPWLDLRVPTFDEPALAPSGCHVVTALVHGVPYAPRGGWTDELRHTLRERALDALERHAPGARRLVVGEECLVPDDIEARYGASGGHLHHGDHALDQLWVLRPSLDTSRYSTPIPGLWLCGSGSHPGGGITCAPGILAARAMLWP